MRVLYLIYIIDVKYEFLIIVDVFVTRYATIHITRYITIYIIIIIVMIDGVQYYYNVRVDNTYTYIYMRGTSASGAEKDSVVRRILALRTR